MGKPAARLTDMTAHGGTITGPGCPTVLIGKMPAARMGDMHMCPMVTPATPPIPHVGGPIIAMGAPTVLIGKMPAATMGDMAICVGPPSTIVGGCPTVLLGPSGAGGGGGGGGGASDAASASTLSGQKPATVKGTENLSVEVQAAIAKAAKYKKPDEIELLIKLCQEAQAAKQSDQKKKDEEKKFTIKDIVEILKEIESEEGYEAARFFASYLDYGRLTEMAKGFTSGEDPNADNDPNQMPTRFMLLYGADDNKLQTIDKHPDSFEGQDEHKITVANLRKGLKLLGYELDDTGPYDDKVFNAHVQYLAKVMTNKKLFDKEYETQKGDDLGTIAHDAGLASWKYLYEKNKDTVGDNPDLLKAGLKLEIPQWESSKGEGKIKDKGAQPGIYTGGACYRYPWVAFSTSIVNEKGEVERESGGKEKKRQYEIRARESGNVIASGEISTADELETLMPDSQSMEITVDGAICDMEMRG